MNTFHAQIGRVDQQHITTIDDMSMHVHLPCSVTPNRIFTTDTTTLITDIYLNGRFVMAIVTCTGTDVIDAIRTGTIAISPVLHPMRKGSTHNWEITMFTFVDTRITPS